MRFLGFLSCACGNSVSSASSSTSTSTRSSRNAYTSSLDSQYSSLQVEETYLRKKYLDHRKTVSFAENLCRPKSFVMPRKAVTSILKSPRLI